MEIIFRVWHVRRPDRHIAKRIIEWINPHGKPKGSSQETPAHPEVNKNGRVEGETPHVVGGETNGTK